MKASHRRITDLEEELRRTGVEPSECRRVSAGLTTLAALDLIVLEAAQEMSRNALLAELISTCRELRGMRW